MMNKKRILKLLEPDWQKGFIMIACFLAISILEFIPYVRYISIGFTWPLYLLPELLGAIIQVLFIYGVATLIEWLITQRRVTAKNSTKKK